MKIILDPGHGGQDAGGRSLMPFSEKEFALEIQPMLWKALADFGYTVLTTRVRDVFVPIGARAVYANMRGADCFISLHGNASTHTKARGPWTIYAAPSTRGKALAETVQRYIAGVARGNPAAAYPDASPWVGNRKLGVLRGTQMPAILLEFGFMTNPDEAERLSDPEYQWEIAYAVARGVNEWNGK